VPIDRYVRYPAEIKWQRAVGIGDVVREGRRTGKDFFNPQQTKRRLWTCGGLLPGLNDVLRSLFLELHMNYGVKTILGIRHDIWA